MYLIYIDDSQDQTSRTFAFSAIAIPEERWRSTFEAVREWRRNLRANDGVFVTKELHAWKLVSGRGQIAQQPVGKWRRCQIFKEGLALLARQDGLRLFNACLQNRQEWAFERLLNRINRTMEAWDNRALLICDEGKESDYTRLVRKMGVHNPIPSRFGVWLDTGMPTRNIPIERIIEDPFFKQSHRSFFIQMADFCAYALLRRECQLPSKNRYGLHRAFELLERVCVREASRADPLGIIR